MLLLTSACGTMNKAMGGNSEKDALIATSWDYGPSDIEVNVETDAELNRYDGEAHSVVLAVIQTAEAMSFYQLLDNAEQLEKTLQGSKSSPSLLQVVRFAIEPARHAVIRIDRTQGAKFVGIVAAYYGVPLAGTAKLFNLPVAVERSGIVVKNYNAKVESAQMQLKLGAQAIVSAVIVAMPPQLPGEGEQVRPAIVGAVKLDGLN